MDKPAEEKRDTRVFMYRLNSDGVTVDAFMFEKPEAIPPDAGWVDSPAKVKPTGKPLIDRAAEDAQVERPMSSIEKARAALAEKRARLKAEQEALDREEKETNG